MEDKKFGFILEFEGESVADRRVAVGLEGSAVDLVRVRDVAALLHLRRGRERRKEGEEGRMGREMRRRKRRKVRGGG